MYIAKAQISLVSVILCMGLISNAYAAASVRVLGSGSNGSAIKATTSARATAPKATVLGAGNTSKKATTMKMSSSGAAGQATIRPVAKATTASAGTPSTTTTTERFPSVASLGNLPTGYKTATTTTGYSMTSVNSKLSDLQDDVDALTNRFEALEVKVDDIDWLREALVNDISTLETVQNNVTELQETVQNIQNNNNNFYIEGGEDAPEEEVANIFVVEDFEERFGG